MPPIPFYIIAGELKIRYEDSALALAVKLSTSCRRPAASLRAGRHGSYLRTSHSPHVRPELGDLGMRMARHTFIHNVSTHCKIPEGFFIPLVDNWGCWLVIVQYFETFHAYHTWEAARKQIILAGLCLPVQQIFSIIRSMSEMDAGSEW